jgi:hypothetical protein
MGKIGKCCCEEESCCLCAEALDYTNWSVTVLGKTFSGTFTEVTCQLRTGDQCIVDNPTLLIDCIQESDWSAATPIGMGGNVCFEACPQCFCLDLDTGQQLTGEACLREDLINWETSTKGVTHSRAWQQEAFYGVVQMICCDSPANSVKFVFDFFYHVARFAAESSQAFRRFRSVSYDCIYDPGQEVTFPDNVVRSPWIEPVTVGSKPPCLPCDWEQSDFFGNCPTLESPCPPCPVEGCQAEIVTYSMDYVAITCDIIGFVDLDGDNICPIPDEEGGTTLVFYGTITMSAYVGSNTNYCGEALSSFGGNCTIDPMTAIIEHRFISDCIPCDELGCSVTLDRVTGGSLGSSLEECLFTEDPDCSCGPIDELCKTIPASITMSLIPCEDDPAGLLIPFPPTFLTIATFPPVIRQISVPATASTALTTFAPTVSATNFTFAYPESAALTLATFAPTPITPQTLTPTTASLILTTFEALLATPLVVTTNTSTLTTTLYAPAIATPQVVTPTNTALVISTFVPTAETPVVVTPTPLALIIDTETTCELILTTYPPDVIVDSVPCVPTVSIVKSVTPNPITLGNIASWTITITNTSSCEVPSGIEVSDQLPDETDILYETGSQYGGTSNDSTSAPILTWVLPAIPVGDSVVLGYDTDTLSTGTFTNLATIDAGTGMGQSDSESLTVN